jgi:sterol desaturase/sphingolipid hydroxylase (fatty acid hydroxylase superfamily)
METLIELFGHLQQAVFEALTQPVLFAVGLGNLLEEAYAATGWFLLGCMQILIMATAIRALERWRPVEPLTDAHAVRVDILYTVIHRLGLFRLVMFFTLGALMDNALHGLRLQGFASWHLDAFWPGVSDQPWVSFLLYLVVFDLVDYLIHRGQHHWRVWWPLHAVHHSQRQLTVWSDSRNHLLDDVIRSAILAVVGLLVGIAPEQFVAVVVCTQLVESLSHANVRLSFGPILGRLLVSPAYHRLHHRIGLGHESAGEGSLGGHNFAVLFPWWDLLFGTARMDDRYEPTGIRDQMGTSPERPGRDYGRGFWDQQWLGLLRLVGRA